MSRQSKRGPGLAVIVAEYVYGPQHAFVFQALLESSVRSFTAYGAARVLNASRVHLIKFILIDLVEIGLLSRETTVFSVSPQLAVDKAIERIPDGHLLAGMHVKPK